jgi:hypothetical protein
MRPVAGGTAPGHPAAGAPTPPHPTPPHLANARRELGRGRLQAQLRVPSQLKRHLKQGLPCAQAVAGPGGSLSCCRACPPAAVWEGRLPGSRALKQPGSGQRVWPKQAPLLGGGGGGGDGAPAAALRVASAAGPASRLGAPPPPPGLSRASTSPADASSRVCSASDTTKSASCTNETRRLRSVRLEAALVKAYSPCAPASRACAGPSPAATAPAAARWRLLSGGQAGSGAAPCPAAGAAARRWRGAVHCGAVHGTVGGGSRGPAQQGPRQGVGHAAGRAHSQLPAQLQRRAGQGRAAPAMGVTTAADEGRLGCRACRRRLRRAVVLEQLPLQLLHLGRARARHQRGRLAGEGPQRGLARAALGRAFFQEARQLEHLRRRGGACAGGGGWQGRRRQGQEQGRRLRRG